MKATTKLMTLVAVLAAAMLAVSCQKEDPVEPLNAVMGGKWVYEEKDATDDAFSSLTETLAFVSETDCKREQIQKYFFHTEKEKFDLTYTFDGEWGTLTGLYNIYTNPHDYPFRYDSIDGTLTVWLSRDTGNPDVKHFVYHRDR